MRRLCLVTQYIYADNDSARVRDARAGQEQEGGGE